VKRDRARRMAVERKAIIKLIISWPEVFHSPQDVSSGEPGIIVCDLMNESYSFYKPRGKVVGGKSNFFFFRLMKIITREVVWKAKWKMTYSLGQK